MNLAKILAADTAGDTMRHLYHKSAYALAGLVPLAALTNEGDGAARAVDAGLAIALPIHSHIALNYVVSDYVPRGMRAGARWGVLATSVVSALGLARLAASGPGLTATVKRLWHPAVSDRVKAEEAKAAKKAAKAAAKA